jgi:hypothetical protein
MDLPASVRIATSQWSRAAAHVLWPRLLAPGYAVVGLISTVFVLWALGHAASEVRSLLLMRKGEYAATTWHPTGGAFRRYDLPILARSDGAGSSGIPSAKSLILFYSPSCSVCLHNMPRWLDLLGTTDSSVQVFAASTTPLATQRDYWHGLDWRLTLLQVRSPDFTQWLPDRVPATLVLRDGRVRLVLVGTLDEHRMRRLRAVLR